MIRSSKVILCLLASAGVFHATEPAPSQTPGAIQVDVPGLKVEQFLSAQEASACSPQPPAYDPVPDLRCLRWVSLPATDAAGSIYFTTTEAGISLPPNPSTLWRTRRDGTTERVVHVEASMLPSGAWATASFLGFVIDSPRGFLYVLLRRSCVPLSADQVCRGIGTSEVARITGLPTFRVGRGDRGD